MSATTAALAADGLGVRFGRTWALRDCSFELPAGRVCALVGPNGAGKSTLINAATGLLSPTEGSLTVWGAAPEDRGIPEGLAVVSQDKPLYNRFTVDEMLRVGQKLNTHWDSDLAARIVAEAGIAPAARIRSLSSGQRTRVALAIALGRRPRLLIMDEPLANLDPLARVDTMRTLLSAVADEGLTVLMSSHVIAELEDTCDHLLLLAGGKILLAGDVETLLDDHRIATGPVGELPFPADSVVEAVPAPRQTTAMLRNPPAAAPGWEFTPPQLEDVLIAHLRAEAAHRIEQQEVSA